MGKKDEDGRPKQRWPSLKVIGKSGSHTYCVSPLPNEHHSITVRPGKRPLAGQGHFSIASPLYLKHHRRVRQWYHLRHESSACACVEPRIGREPSAPEVMPGVVSVSALALVASAKNAAAVKYFITNSSIKILPKHVSKPEIGQDSHVFSI